MTLVSYARMLQSGILPNKHTFPSLLKNLSKSKSENPLQIYAQIVKFGFDSDRFVRNTLISALSSNGCINFARQLFDETPHKDVVTWTAMIDGYVKSGLQVEAFKCFMVMKMIDNVRVDEGVVVSLLRAAGMVQDVWFGRWVHGYYIESGRVIRDVYVWSALVDMYCKCSCCDDARRVFDEILFKNVVSWSALISGYVNCSRYKEALSVFQDMLLSDVEPNQLTLSSVLTACAQLGALGQGKWVHEYIARRRLKMNAVLGTALVDMYAKCGCIDEAVSIFEKTPVKDVYPWTAMINGFAVHGDGLRSLELFNSMLSKGIVPNEVTFLSVLSACSHGGLVNEGRKIFRLMSERYRLEPNVAHYGCMADLLGRAGHLEEARNLIETMPVEPTPGLWGALFNACMIHRDYELGEIVGRRLIYIQPKHSGGYALLANMYSLCQKPEKAAQMRKLMKKRGIEKKAGCSWMEVNGIVHQFIASDWQHSRSSDVYAILDSLKLHLKCEDWVPNTWILATEVRE